jgi:hypothetical protein
MPGLMAPTPNFDGFWREPASELEGLVPAAQELAEVAAGLPECEPAGRLAQRLGAGRFLVSAVGEYKRGKSTLINALLRAEAMPTGMCYRSPRSPLSSRSWSGQRPSRPLTTEAGMLAGQVPRRCQTLFVDPGYLCQDAGAPAP